MSRSIRLLTLTAFFSVLLITVLPVYGQMFGPSVGISIILKPSDQAEARAGLIVAKNASEYYITRSYQDPNMAGVIAEKTDMLYTTDNDEQNINIAIDGVADVWVSPTFGKVKYGDFITTSTEAGIGVKALEKGPVIGYALEDAPAGEGPHLIPIQITLSDSWDGSISQKGLFKQSSDTFSRLLSNIEFEAQEESKGFLYIVVFIVVILTSIFGFITFGKIAINGINAVGRNPLAKNTIVKTIIINSFITILFTLGSVVIALLITR